VSVALSKWRRSCSEDLVHVATATFTVGGAEAGSAELVRVKRDSDANFHELCDAESAELQFAGVELCDARGAVRPASVREADVADEAGDGGGFLYISSLDLAGGSAPAAIRALLRHKDVKDEWSLCCYLGDGRHGATPEARAAAAVEDVRRFVRAGFKQVIELVSPFQTPVVFATPSMLEAPCLAASAEAFVAVPPPRKVRSPASEQLFEAVMALDSSGGGSGALSPAFLATARELISKKGASLADACVLHVIVANGRPETAPAEIDAVLALAPSAAARAAALNAEDSDSLTPLMVAAASSPGMGSKDKPVPTAVCAHLIALGAHKDVRDRKGRLARDHAAAAAQSIRDMLRAFRIPGGADDKALQKLLRV
jgi:hypothetical protein